MTLDVFEPQVNNPASSDQNKVGEPSSKSKNTVIIIIVVLVLGVVFASILYVVSSMNSAAPVSTPTPVTTSSATSSEVKNDSDLKKLEEQVKNTNIDQDLNEGLDENDQDAAAF
ncbi:MAG: hypothetical protein A2172_02855 [Candidatus Woykebacteria bacterium RBG_13_40_15]|uniref:Uncharacterized protein n=1 Tax=Candidatus Woykebacteria bacterium RBG_13_40_15 TaxID=1802593 RepID=A0A1G1W6L9_9BACT|nr:MAG: hypothetical protein A2172_02855 [Candidatus Woykebacteria bacterium RBG_13_40_15]